jgi:hypothetical protein
VIFIDTETTGLDCHSDQLTAVGVAFDDSDPLVLRHPDDRDLIQRVLQLEDAFTAHNATFDFGFLESSGYAIPDPGRWTDTVLMAHIAGERKPGQTRLDQLQKQLVAAGELPANILAHEERIKAWLRTARKAAKKNGDRTPQKGDAPPAILNPYLRADVASNARGGAPLGRPGRRSDGNPRARARLPTGALRRRAPRRPSRPRRRARAARPHRG